MSRDRVSGRAFIAFTATARRQGPDVQRPDVQRLTGTAKTAQEAALRSTTLLQLTSVVPFHHIGLECADQNWNA